MEFPDAKRRKTESTSTGTDQDRFLAAFRGEEDVHLSDLASRAALDEKVAFTLAGKLCKMGAIYITLEDDVFCLVPDWTDDQHEEVSASILSFSERTFQR